MTGFEGLRLASALDRLVFAASALVAFVLAFGFFAAAFAGFVFFAICRCIPASRSPGARAPVMTERPRPRRDVRAFALAVEVVKPI